MERVTVSPMLPLQSSSIQGAELDAPEANRLATDGDATFSEQIFYIPVTEIEAVVEPDGVRNYIWRKSVAFICIHSPILPFLGS